MSQKHLILKLLIFLQLSLIYGLRLWNHENDLEKIFDNRISLDPARRLTLFWTVEKETIYFYIKAKITKFQFLGFGFSNRGGNENADIALFLPKSEGNYLLKDCYTDDRGNLHVDKKQDIELLFSRRNEDGSIGFAFERKLDTCDKEDYAIDRGTTHMVFFIGNFIDPKLFGHPIEKYHPKTQVAQLVRSEIPIPKLPKDVIVVDLLLSNVKIPSDGTTYWCETKKLPPMAHKNHIIRFDGIVTKANEGIVHHMEIFHCEVPVGVKVPYFSGPCPQEGKKRMDVNTAIKKCHKVIGAWAMGAKPFIYPEEAGVPIGGPNWSRYVVVQVHFNNPNHKKGIIDSSGIKFYITPTPRKYDAGIMELGLEYTAKNSIPPHVKDYVLSGFCVSECTRVGLPPKGIVIFGSQLHTHLTGVKVVTKHYRNGKELPELNRDNHYTTEFQEIRLLPRPVHIQPGDDLVTSCTYTTTKKDTMTLGGYGIDDEMCVNYVHYFPKTDLEVCKSSIDTDALNSFFKFMRSNDNDNTSPKKSVEDNFRSIRWTPLAAKLLKTLYNESPIDMQCNRSNGNRFPGQWGPMPQTTVLYPLPKPEKCDN